MTANPMIDTNVDIQALMERMAKLEEKIEFLEEQVPDDRITIVVFSGSLDKMFAAFIIATGALAMGHEVSMFFTFWGINALRRERILEGKGWKEKAFSMLTPPTSDHMGISQLNFFGLGARMMRELMQEKNVHSFEELFSLTQEMGAKMIVCGMSQDVMGIHPDEIHEVEDGGVAAMLADGFKSKATFFI